MIEVSNQIIIADPMLGLEDSITIDNVESGDYNISIIKFDPLSDKDVPPINDLFFYNSNYKLDELNFGDTVAIHNLSSVCGVFDGKYLKNNIENDNFFEECSQMTLKAVENPEWNAFERVDKDNVKEFMGWLNSNGRYFPTRYNYFMTEYYPDNKGVVFCLSKNYSNCNFSVALNEENKVVGIRLHVDIEIYN